MYTYLLARGYEICQKWLRLYSRFDRPYFRNHIWCLVGVNECGLETSYCLEIFYACTFMAFVFAPRNWKDRESRHHRYWLSSSSLASITAWDQLHGKTLAGQRAYCKVKRTNRVGSVWIVKYNHWWSSPGHIEVTRQSWNFNCKKAKVIQTRQFRCTYIDFVERHNTLNWQQRTS